MSKFSVLESRSFKPDGQALVDTLVHKKTAKRVHNMELFLEEQVQEVIAGRYGLTAGCEAGAPDYPNRRHIAVQRFCGYDFVKVPVADIFFPMNYNITQDTAEMPRKEGRHYINEQRGPITNWQEFEKYPWPSANEATAMREFEWYEKHTPADMCLVAAGGFGHIAEHLTWLMGYETFCYALYDNRELVQTLADKIIAHDKVILERILQFKRVAMVWGSDDMGYRSGLLMSAADMRHYVLSGHKVLAAMAHQAGKPYLLHSCGNLREIMDDLIDDVKIDAKHSFEDTIEDVCGAKRTWGRKIGMIGGIDLDFLCRRDEEAIRRRVRQTLDVCMPGGGYCLGSGNSIANYVPLDHYLAMMDEGMRYGH